MHPQQETQPEHFTQAVAELGEKQPVVASIAIFNDKGVKVVEKGTAINLALYQRLTQHRLALPIENSVRSAPIITTEVLRLSAHEALQSIAFFARMVPDLHTRNLLVDAVSTVPLPDPIAFQLTIAHQVRPEIFQHLIRTALTSAWLSKTPLLNRFDTRMAATAGLLHDIGMLHIDPVVLQPTQRLNREQRRQLYSHPLVSTTLLERQHQYPKEVIRAVREHHEYLDGSGYPQNLVGDQISQMGKMLSLASVVAAMFSPGRLSAELRLSVLLRMNTHRYDSTLSQQVISLLRPEADTMLDGQALLDDPAQLLGEMDTTLKRWPAYLADDATVSPARRTVVTRLGDHVAQIHRALANVGATPDQLVLLGSAAGDTHLLREMSLLAREAGWQLRTLARQTRRRWKTSADEALPAPLQTWLDAVDTLVGPLVGVESALQAPPC